MKLIAIIAVGDDRVRILATRAPDGARRDLGALQPGAPALLIWCSVPPTGLGASALAERIATRLGAIDASGIVAATPAAARRAAVIETLVLPAVEGARSRARRWLRAARRRLFGFGRRTASAGGA